MNELPDIPATRGLHLPQDAIVPEFRSKFPRGAAGTERFSACFQAFCATSNASVTVIGRATQHGHLEWAPKSAQNTCIRELWRQAAMWFSARMGPFT